MSGEDPVSESAGASGDVWRPPSEFDGFRVLRQLGEGGMGRVYLGHESLLDRPVALKFIAAMEPDPGSRRRFLVEAQAIARLQHPNVVSNYRVGEVGGRPYIAYEFIPGVSLGELPGDDHVPFAGDVDRLFAEIDLFLAEARASPGTAPMFATVAVVRGGDVADALLRAWRNALARWGGTELSTIGGELAAMFNGPADAVRCACGMIEESARLGVTLRSGVHIGELRLQGGEIVGRGRELAAELAAGAPPGEVIVSAALKDLVRGEPFALEEIAATRVFRARAL
jgi:hypothetical protein